MIFRRFNIFVLAGLSALILISSCKKDDDDETGNPPAAPVVSKPLHVYGDNFYVNWIGVTNAQGYVADVATDQDFTNILPDYNNMEVEINGMFLVKGVNPSSTYYVRMRAYNADGSSGNSAVKEFNTNATNDLPNGGMEDWIQYPNYESPYPDGVWASANKVVDLNPDVYPVLLFKTTDAYSGTYAAKAVTNDALGQPLLAGSLSTGLFNVDFNNPLKSLITGVPYNNRPLRFQGYFKYEGVDGDSCEIRTTLSKWNGAEHQRDKVGEVVFRTTDLVDEYTYFDLEIVYFSATIPDTIDMVFAASAGGEYFVGGIGSTLYIDAFNLTFE